MLSMGETPNPYPSRKTLDYRGPVRIDTRDAVCFITIDAEGKYDGGAAVSSKPPYREILDAARFRQERGDWFLHLFLVMPDHIHLLAHFPPDKDMVAVIADFKRYLSTAHHIRFQRDFSTRAYVMRCISRRSGITSSAIPFGADFARRRVSGRMSSRMTP